MNFFGQIEHKIVNSSERVTSLAIKARENTWSHQRRKRRQNLLHENIGASDTKNSERTVLDKTEIQEKYEGIESVLGKREQNLTLHNTELCTLSKLQSDGSEEKNGNRKDGDNKNMNIALVANMKKRALETDDDPAYKRQKIAQLDDGTFDQTTGNQNNNSCLQSDVHQFEKAGLQDSNVHTEEHLSDKDSVDIQSNKESELEEIKMKCGKDVICPHTLEEKVDKEDMDLGGENAEVGVNTKNIVKSDDIEKNVTMDTTVETNSKSKEVFLLKCKLIIKQKTVEEIVVEMVFEAGENREHMHQIMQYFKNKLKSC